MENDFNNFLVSVVIPIYNEENIIQELFKRLNKTLKEFEEFEVIADDSECCPHGGFRFKG